MKEEYKINLLKDAFNDNKNTISNLDIKARFLLAINLAFIAGIFIIFRFLYKEDIICKFQRSYLIFLLIIGIIIIIYDLFIIFLLINNVINPRNNPKTHIKNIENFYFLNEDSIFFPILPRNNNSFNYENYWRRLEKLSLSEIKQIYLFELLKISFIRGLYLIFIISYLKLFI
jgi:hypothetical protein